MSALAVLNKVLQQLRAHRALLEDAILALERVQGLSDGTSSENPDDEPKERRPQRHGAPAQASRGQRA